MRYILAFALLFVVGCNSLGSVKPPQRTVYQMLIDHPSIDVYNGLFYIVGRDMPATVVVVGPPGVPGGNIHPEDVASINIIRSPGADYSGRGGVIEIVLHPSSVHAIKARTN